MTYKCGSKPQIGDEIDFSANEDFVLTKFVNRVCYRDGQLCVGFPDLDPRPASLFSLKRRLRNQPLHSSPVLFLDIDGVLNAHEANDSGYSGISRPGVHNINWLIRQIPQLKIVISSAWRYMILRGDMTLTGFEYMFRIHGILALDRIDGHTRADDDLSNEPSHDDKAAWHKLALKTRASQIMEFVEEKKLTRWAAVDDLPLEGLPNFVRTNGNIGLTKYDCSELMKLLAPVAD